MFPFARDMGLSFYARLLAVSAHTVYLHTMGFRFEPVFCAHLILQAFDCFVFELNYLATTGAYEVVMVLVSMDMLVMGMFLSEDYLSKVSALYEQCEGAVDSGLGDALVVLSEA